MNTFAKLFCGAVAALAVAACGATADSPEGTGSSSSALICPEVACPAGAVLNPNTCGCEPPIPICDPLVCRKGQHWVGQPVCKCEPNCAETKLCILGDHWDPVKCECVPNCPLPVGAAIVCPVVGEQWNPITCVCGPPLP
jgi:hypothetical protein